jgi:hypothetical protein
MNIRCKKKSILSDIRSPKETMMDTRDVDASARFAAEPSGKVCLPPQDIPKVGRFHALQDPQGAMIKSSPISSRELDSTYLLNQEAAWLPKSS